MLAAQQKLRDRCPPALGALRTLSLSPAPSPSGRLVHRYPPRPPRELAHNPGWARARAATEPLNESLPSGSSRLALGAQKDTGMGEV